jgi:hypothetical protein
MICNYKNYLDFIIFILLIMKGNFNIDYLNLFIFILK